MGASTFYIESRVSLPTALEWMPQYSGRIAWENEMGSIQVHVVFIDAATGQAFGETDMPLERLPSSFELATTMHIGNSDWRVTLAEPMTAEEFGKTGELRLTMSEVVRMPPQDILYTVPTLWSDIPPLVPGGSTQGKHVFRLHEDDWRQVELVSASYQNTIRTECEAVARIFNEAGEFNGKFWGFRDIYIRGTIIHPVRPAIRLSDLTAAFPKCTQRFDAVSYKSADGVIGHSFAYDLGGLALYGLEEGGMATIVGLQRYAEATGINSEVPSALAQIMAAQRAYLVDWCRTMAVPPQADALRQYFGMSA